MSTSCPCDSGKAYQACCAPCHQGTLAANAEALMRSRYSAYVIGIEPYLLATWHPDTRPTALNLAEDQATKWLGLSIKRFEETRNNWRQKGEFTMLLMNKTK